MVDINSSFVCYNKISRFKSNLHLAAPLSVLTVLCHLHYFLSLSYISFISVDVFRFARANAFGLKAKENYTRQLPLNSRNSSQFPLFGLSKDVFASLLVLKTFLFWTINKKNVSWCSREPTLGSQSEQSINFILIARGANHTIIWYVWHILLCFDWL